MKMHGTQGGNFEFELNPTFYTNLATTYQMLPEGAKSVIALLKLLLDVVLSTLTVPLEVLLLNRWGTRALSLFQVLQVTGMAGLAVMLRDPFVSVFMLSACIAAWWRFIEARRGEWTRKPYRHSYTPGEPVVLGVVARFLVEQGVPRWLFAEAYVFRAWEPATGILVGILLLILPPTRFLGLVLIGIGIAFIVKRHVMYLRHVEMWRDKADAEAVGRAMTAEEDAPEQVHLVRLAASDVIPLVPTKPGSKPTAEKISVTCSACKSRIKCPKSKAGETLSCPKCHVDFLVPAA
jgi:hypothetical protein